MEMNKKIGKFLKAKRKEFKFNQPVVAKYLGISSMQYSNYETGKSEINISKLIKLSFLLGFELNEISALIDLNEVNKL